MAKHCVLTSTHRQWQRPLLLTLSCLALVLALAAPAPAGQASRLVSAQWLAQHLDDPNLVVIDASPTKEYLKRHLKGAVSASFSEKDYMSYGIDTSYGGNDLINDPQNPLPWWDAPAEYLQKVFRDLGVNKDSKVVVYDEGAHFHATRFYWTLTHNGMHNAFILDGGMAKWEALGLPTVQEQPQTRAGNFTCKAGKPNILVDTDYVLARQFKPETVIVYAVTPVWFYGPFQAYSKMGHIPGSVMVSYPSYFQADKTWKSVDDLKRLFASVGATPDKEIIAYCGGNPAASLLYFTLHHILGYPNVKYYYGSTVQWVEDPRDLPLHTYWNQHLLRDGHYATWWAGTRIQFLVADSQVLAVDLRPRADYQAGHLPYAVNLPLEELFAQHGLDPAAWSRELGATGCANWKELLLIGEPRAASLMFWLLEYLGQPKTSILNGGMNGLKQVNAKTTSEATIIAPPKTKYDAAIAPARFQAQVQGGLRLTDPAQKPDFLGYDRVWVVASEQAQAPPAAGDAKVAHIPWTRNFLEGGWLNFASELIKLYENAGVFKQAEVVCYSSDIAEAAAAYYALRTLGYPRVMIYTAK
ncbi:MAG: rhodanese-like domain-containing protein [Pseudomonadota bacterium]